MDPGLHGIEHTTLRSIGEGGRGRGGGVLQLSSAAERVQTDSVLIIVVTGLLLQPDAGFQHGLTWNYILTCMLQ